MRTTRSPIPVEQVHAPETAPERKKRAVTARGSKAKGKAFEKRICEMIASSIGMELSDVQNARSGKKESDIALSAEARKRFPYHVECKNQRSLNIPAYIRQMESDLTTHRKAGTAYATGLVVFKQHGDGTPYALVRFDYLLKLLTERGK